MLGSYVYDHSLFPDTRGELALTLANCVLELTGETSRLSNGAIVDALLAALDLLPDTPDNREKIDGVLSAAA